jgi:hypothetical protein
MSRIDRVALAALFCLVFCVGCSENADSSTSILGVTPDDDYFYLTASAPDGGYSLDRTYEWRCSTGKAEVVIDTVPDAAGTVRVVFLDGAGQVVYEQNRIYPGGSFVRDDSYQGIPGQWSVCIVITDLKGIATITAVAK